MTVIEDNLGHFFDATDEAINEALTVVGMNAANYARNNAPVDTGHLRNSISLSMPLDERNTVIIGSNVEYAPYQELGTSKMQAANNGKGYLRPAINDHIDEYKTTVAQIVAKHMQSL